MVNFSEEHLNNIESCLFGQQRQASVINGAVVKIVARELLVVMGFKTSSSIDEANSQIIAYLHQAENDPNKRCDDSVIMLIAGEQSLANVESGELTTLSVTNISDTSTKRNYRILLDGQEPDIDMSGAEGSAPVSTTNVSKEGATGIGKQDPNADFYTQAKQLLEAIRPLIPDAVKTEIPDNEYAQALVCAQSYFEYNK